MRLSLKTKFTLATSLLVLAVVAVVSGLYLGAADASDAAPGERHADFRRPAGLRRVRQCAEGRRRARRVARFARSRRPARVRPARVRQQQHAEFADRIGRGKFADDLRNHDHATRTAWCWCRATRRCATRKSRRAPAAQLAGARRFFEQMRELYGPPQTYEFLAAASSWGPSLSATFASGFPRR